MEFDKPKVTIDLAEYQTLKDQVKQFEDNRNSDGFYDVARVILWAFSARDLGSNNIKSFLAQHGIEYFITTNGTRYPSYQDIVIRLKEK